MARARSLTRFEWACVAVVALAFLLRVDLAFHPNVIWDSAWYLQLARSVGDTGRFVMPWTDPPQTNGYWPPLFPLFAAPFVKLFGPTYATLVVASCAAAALLTVATLACTWDLYGRTRAFAATALVAANPAFFVSDWHGMSESLLALAVGLAVWAFLKALRDARWIPVAGAFAVLAYLGKPNLGAPLVVAGLVAVGAWRVATRGWRPVEVGAGVAALVAVAGVALVRPTTLGGVGLGVIQPLAEAFTRPAFWGPVPYWVVVLPFKLAFALAFLAAVTLPFSLRAPAAARAWRDERTGALWLATLLPLAAGALFTTAFFFTESRQLVDFDNIRYLTPSILPALWLTLPHWPVEDDPRAEAGAQHKRRHEVWFGLAAGLYVLLLFLSPMAGDATLGRLELLLVLALVPLALALAARHASYGVATRRAASGAAESRYVPAKPSPTSRRAAWGLALALVATAALAWFVSAWYVSVAMGLVVALCAVSRKAQALTLALVLLAATAPGFNNPLPAEAAMRDVAALVPAGTPVGVVGPIVYVSAVAPNGVKLREVHDANATGFDAVLFTNDVERAPPGFAHVETWNYTFAFSPTLRARLWIESNLLSQRIDAPEAPALALWVRTNSTLYQRLLSS